MAKAGSLTIDLSANTARLGSDFTKASAMVNKYQKNARDSFSKVSSAVFSVKSAVLGLAGGAGFGILIKQSLSSADALAKTADKLGITTQGLAGLRHAADLTGVSQNTMDMALQRMTRRLAEAAQGTGEAKNAIAELGLDAKKLAAQSPEKSFSEIADAMGGVANQGDKVRLAMKFFDSEGVALVNTLALQRDGLSAASDEAEALGLSLSRVNAAKIEAANDAITRAKGVIKGAAQSVAVELSPYIAHAATLFVDMAKKSGGFGNIAKSAIESVVLGIAKLADVVNGLQVAWQGIKVIVLGFSSAVMMSINTIIGGWLKLADLIPGIDLKSPITALDEETAKVKQSLINAEVQLHNMMMKKPPSEGIKAAFAEIVAEANAAGMAVAESKIATGEVTNQIATDLMNDEAHLMRMSEAMKTLDAQNGVNARIELANKEAEAKRNIMGGMFGNLATLMGSKSRKLFEIGKKAAIAGALIKGYESVLNSYAAGSKIGGPILGAAFAATAGIATAVQIQGIKSQQFGGGGGVSTGGSPGVPSASIPTASDFITPEQRPDQSKSAAPRELRIVVESDGVHSDGMRKFAQDLAETIKDMGGVSSLVVS